ncbi:MAG: 23S rRNA (adenine(2503)-C(2))-methyltransferase RlmN [Bdellovibrionota bacterium]
MPFQSLTKDDLAELLQPIGRKYQAKQIFKWVYQRFVNDWDEMTDLSKVLRSWLKTNVEIHRLQANAVTEAADGTKKILWKLHDGETVESVLIPVSRGSSNRLTACISSQVGCAMACKFCLTGTQGFKRHLEAHEIVSQAFELRRLAPVTNIVFMGMGEPLHNLANVIKSCMILLDGDGMAFSKRRVTISTSGLVTALEELGRNTDVSLAVSLNATTDEQRSSIMPVNKKWNIASLIQACKSYPLGNHRRITFEYVLIEGFNDSIDDAKRLAKLLKPIPSKINLIPFNEFSGSKLKRPSDESVRLFQKYLLDKGFTATVRNSRGSEILAACGQLRSAM